MDNVVIGESAIVAACAFVKAGMIVPPRVLVAGVPGKVVRELTAHEMAWKAEGTRTYRDLAVRSLATMCEVEPLAEIEAGRRRLQLPEIKPLIDTRKA